MLFFEPLPDVVGNNESGAFIFREQGIFSIYYQGPRELLSRFSGTREHRSIFELFFEPLPDVVGNNESGAFIFREQGIFSIYYQGTRELLSRFSGTREHQSIFNN